MSGSLENRLQELGYEYVDFGNHVYEVKNVLTQDDLDILWAYINAASQDDWEKDYRESQIDLAERKFGRRDLDNLIEEGLVEFTKTWYDKSISIPRTACTKVNKRVIEILQYDPNLYFGGIDTIQRQYSGHELKEHVDNDADPDVELAAILYINDDYSDGELFFSKLNLEIRPKAKSMMIFPGGSLYSHGVKAPGEGPLRYVLPTFIRSHSSLNG